MGILDWLFGGSKEEAAPETPPITYSTGSGETLRSIARKFYGNETQWERLYRRNSRILEDAEGDIYPGTQLTIPDPKYDLEGNPIKPEDAESDSE